MYYLLMAFRNVSRNRRRAKLNIVALVIGLTMLITVGGLVRGLTTSVYSNMMSMDTGQVQVEAAGYRADARRWPLDRVVADPEAVVRTLLAVPGVAAASVRVDAFVELTNGVEGARAMLRGIDAAESKVTAIADKIVAGGFLAPGKPGLLVGKPLAEKLGLKPGDQAFFTGLDSHSVRNLGSCEVTGLFEFGFPAMDDFMVFMDLGQARDFLALGASATRVAIRASDPRDDEALTARVAAALADRPGLRAYDWKVFAESLVSTIETRLQIIRTMMSLLFGLIAVGIFNTMGMSVRERVREIGTMRAVGIRRGGLRRLFLAEGLVLGVAGCLIACVPAGIVGTFMSLVGLDLRGIFPPDVPIPFGSVMRSSYYLGDILLAFAVALGAAVLGAIVPAVRASRMPITDCLGNVK